MEWLPTMSYDAVIVFIDQYIKPFAPAAQGITGIFAFVSFLNFAWLLRKATIYVVNADDPSALRKRVGTVSARFLSRSEINGIISQRAGPRRLDFTRSGFEYKFQKEIEIALPADDYNSVNGA